MIRQVMNFDVTKNEYLCPMCERLSNNALPLMPAVPNVIQVEKGTSQSFYSWSEKAKKQATAKVYIKNYRVTNIKWICDFQTFDYLHSDIFLKIPLI